MKRFTLLAGVVSLAIFSAGCCCSGLKHEARNSGAERQVVETQVVHTGPPTRVVDEPLPTTVYYYGYAQPTGPTLTKVTTVTTVNGPMEEEAYYSMERPRAEEIYVGGTTAPYSTSVGAGGSTVEAAHVPEGQQYRYGTTVPYTTNIGGDGSPTVTTTTTWSSSAAQGQVPPTQNNPVYHGAGLYYDKYYFNN